MRSPKSVQDSGKSSDPIRLMSDRGFPQFCLISCSLQLESTKCQWVEIDFKDLIL